MVDFNLLSSNMLQHVLGLLGSSLCHLMLLGCEARQKTLCR